MDDGLRASDADRDRAAAQLQVHFAAGRLTRGELDDRLTAALRAVTIGDLRRELADLPAPAPRRDGSLERRYRRLLAFYPPRYRRVHEEEMLAVLMTTAPEGMRRPGLAEAADLIVDALRVWCQPPRAGVGWRGVLTLASAGAVLGVLAGLAFAAVNPPLPTSNALVRLYASNPRESFAQFEPQAQRGFANSQVVLERAAQAIGPAISLQTLRSQVQISYWCPGLDTPPRTCNNVAISVQAATPAQADRAVGAVAHSFIAYVGGHDLLGIAPASAIPGTSVLADALETGGLGALCGALIGASGAAALSRPGRRFRMT